MILHASGVWMEEIANHTYSMFPHSFKISMGNFELICLVNLIKCLLASHKIAAMAVLFSRVFAPRVLGAARYASGVSKV